MKRIAYVSVAALLAATSVPALAQEQDQAAATAQASVIDTEGSEIGTLELTSEQDGVHITGELTGLTEGQHGFHIHETGECNADEDFSTAGDHFAPDDNQHGLDNPEGPHAGDMPNQTVSAEGVMNVDVTNDRVSLNEGEDGYLLDDDGSAIMVHANEDDQMTDPGGNSGDRVACGVIEFATQTPPADMADDSDPD